MIIITLMVRSVDRNLTKYLIILIYLYFLAVNNVDNNIVVKAC